MLTHPGPADPIRILDTPCHAHRLDLTLKSGRPLHEAIVQAVHRAGFYAAWLWVAEAHCDQLSYVIPGPPPGDGRVAFYSDTYVLRPQEDTLPCIAAMGLHLGKGADGADIHAHGLWTDAQSRTHMGHLRAEQTYLARDVQITGWGIDGAIFQRVPDPETGFDLFTPRRTELTHSGGQPARLLRLRPHLDLASTLGGLIAPHSTVMGLGSLIGAQFLGAPSLPPPATEIVILEHAAPRLRIAAVARDGSPRQGWLSGENPICITAELLAVDPPPRHSSA
ncbi:hypothetical protein [Paracoccus homiensis]|uniref:PPC domain-containing protein n=1 Tax=Paracoccus homiensis TaxID=364199 RepID=A0A1I0HG43_9RHOB|nr:hypothetical protein [Paracoccus homiensis]SET82027.1 hypothetical protein SAMN04489858_11126 [Paracoccus homiensis]